MTFLWAGMAELVDAPDSKSGDGDIVSVRFRLSVPKKKKGLQCNPFFLSKIFQSLVLRQLKHQNRYEWFI